LKEYCKDFGDNLEGKRCFDFVFVQIPKMLDDIDAHPLRPSELPYMLE